VASLDKDQSGFGMLSALIGQNELAYKVVRRGVVAL
jgi:hypothetical protein